MYLTNKEIIFSVILGSVTILIIIIVILILKKKKKLCFKNKLEIKIQKVNNKKINRDQ